MVASASWPRASGFERPQRVRKIRAGSRRAGAHDRERSAGLAGQPGTGRKDREALDDVLAEQEAGAVPQVEPDDFAPGDEDAAGRHGHIRRRDGRKVRRGIDGEAARQAGGERGDPCVEGGVGRSLQPDRLELRIGRWRGVEDEAEVRRRDLAQQRARPEGADVCFVSAGRAGEEEVHLAARDPPCPARIVRPVGARIGRRGVEIDRAGHRVVHQADMICENGPPAASSATGVPLSTMRPR